MFNDGICSIELTLEDCDFFEIPRECIGSFLISKIRTTIEGDAYSPIKAINWADEVLIQISDEPFDILNDPLDEDPLLDFSAYRPSFLRLLEFEDVTRITIKFDDGDRETFAVEYEETLGGNNLFQQTRLAKNGSLYILIGKDLKMEDYVPADKILSMQEHCALQHAIRLSGGIDDSYIDALF